jgi:multidrug efflux pump subunit AcrB
MKRIVEFFIHNSLIGNTLVILMMLFGYWGLNSMRSTLFPSAPLRFIKIQTVLPGASPTEMEEGIVLKIEENLQTVTGIERVSSVSSENSAMIDVEIKKNSDIDIVLQDVKNAVNQIPSFPVGMEAPQIFKVENRSFAFSFALSGEVPLRTLKEFARTCEDELRRTGIMSKITLSGFPREEIEIAFRENDLRKYQMSIAEAANAVRAANIEVTGGRIKGAADELLLRARNKGYYADDLLNTPVKTTAEGGVIYLYQVADVKDQWEDAPARSYLNGKSSVVVSIDNTDDEDVLTITKYMNKYVEDFNAKNEVVKAAIIRDGSITLRQRIELLAENGITGFFLVLAALTLFLNRQLAFWVASSIPISFAGLFMISAMVGLSINVISLFGMIVVVGILVDDGIVISENIYSYYEKGYSREEAAIKGTLDVLPSVFSAIMTTVVAFSAFFFLDGRIGDIFFDLAAVVCITLLVSLAEGMLVLPAHIMHSDGLAGNEHKKPANWLNKGIDMLLKPIVIAMDWLMAFMRERLYAPALAFLLNKSQRFIALAFFVGTFMVAIAALMGGKVKVTFFPFIERDDIDVAINMPSGTRDSITMQRLGQIEQAAWIINDEIKKERPDGKDIIEKIEKNVGPATHQGKLKIGLLNGEERQMSVLKVSDLIRKKAGEIAGAENVAYGAATPFGKPVSVSVLGKNAQNLSAAVAMLKAEISQIEGLADVIDNNQEGLREVNIQLTDKARQLGLSLQEIMSQVRQGFFGNEVQRVQRGRDEVRIWVRYAESDRQNIGQLENMRIRFADGREYPLNEIARTETQRGLIAINHISGQREIKVEADIADRRVSVIDITNQIRNEIIPKIQSQYPDTQFLLEGQNKENEKTMRSFATVLPIIGILMVVIILFTFGSVSQTLAVVVTIPFGFVGVVWGHYWLDAPLSFFSFLGMVALVGIMVNDSLVLVAALNDRLKEGMDFDEALFQAGVSRFRAIWLTSLTTILGLAPLMLEKSFQAQFLIPMAVSIAFGLFMATFLTLLALPVFLSLFNSYKVLVVQLWTGERVEKASLEASAPARQNHFWLWLSSGLVLIFAFILLRSLITWLAG